MQRTASVARWIAARAGEAVDVMVSARLRARAATITLQHLPDSTLRWLAAGLAGLGTGFYLAGAPRPVVTASVAPVVLLGAAIVLRPLRLATPVARHWWTRAPRSVTP